jgi:glycosyltransferase involved in cell wall biosynthesis
VPYVVVAHGTDVTSLGRTGALARTCFRATMAAACVVPVSHAMLARLRDELGLPDSVPTEVINMGVDRRVFRPIDGARASFGWADDERIVLFAGNLIPRKAPEVLVEAFARLRRAGTADRLVICGDGEMRGAVEAAAEASGLRDAVTLTGALPPDRLAAAMSAADVFVLPSLAEPLGVVLLEAMACGTPCVASRVGGIPEVLTEGSGLLVPPGDPEALAAGIERVLASGKDTYRQACLEAAAESDLDVNTGRLIDVLRRAVAASEVRS